VFATPTTVFVVSTAVFVIPTTVIPILTTVFATPTAVFAMNTTGFFTPTTGFASPTTVIVTLTVANPAWLAGVVAARIVQITPLTASLGRRIVNFVPPIVYYRRSEWSGPASRRAA